ncbi:MAG: UDP-N-acetylmuramoyl-tripeptide--D-alanyl-D-alanine ligase [Acidobacteriota bacterium]|jgi:UDP-N-acetylmuramoyl-tripeptide--D-alanyl-D-alanine ligase
MIPLTARQIAEAVEGRMVSGSAEITAGRVGIDSRRLGAGDCFFAIVGEHHDGHDFIPAAAAAGAAVVVAQRVPAELGAEHTALIEVADTTAALQALGGWLRRELDPTVIGITGSLGKTTTKELTAALIGLRFSVHATPGNLNNHWGLPLSLLGLEPHHDVMVAEMAMSAPGEIRALARIAAPEIGVITNIAPAHMMNFADLDEVAAAKGELAEELPSSGTLIVNADDARAAAMPGRVAPRVAHVLRFGCDDRADVRAAGAERVEHGWRFELRADGGSWPIELQLAGAAGLYCFLGAAAAAWAVGVPFDQIAAHATELRPLANRGGLHRLKHVTLLDESYNASPVAVQAALDTLAGLSGTSRHIAVLGDMLEMGEWTAQVHREVGAHAATSGVDLLVAVGAFANLIVEGAVASGMDEDDVVEFDTADQAATWLAPRLASGDTILVKGSRAVHLEHVVDAVRETTAETTGARED